VLQDASGAQQLSAGTVRFGEGEKMTIRTSTRLACAWIAAATMACATGCSGTTGSHSIGGGPSAPSGNNDNNGPEDCATIFANYRGQGATIVADSWANVPAALWQLPPDGKLCGAITLSGASRPFVTISSGLWDTQLYDFYAPLVKKLGCTLQPVKSQPGLISYADVTCPGLTSAIIRSEVTSLQIVWED
jgi:hypothetical protein